MQDLRDCRLDCCNCNIRKCASINIFPSLGLPGEVGKHWDISQETIILNPWNTSLFYATEKEKIQYRLTMRSVKNTATPPTAASCLGQICIKETRHSTNLSFQKTTLWPLDIANLHLPKPTSAAASSSGIAVGSGVDGKEQNNKWIWRMNNLKEKTTQGEP